MNAVEMFRNGEIDKEELLKRMEADPSIRAEAQAALDEQLDDDELEKISAAGQSYSVQGDMSW